MKTIVDLEPLCYWWF